MTNVYVLDQNLNRISIINNYTALQWSLVWSDSGSFSLWAPLTEENKTYLVEDNLIWIEGDTVGVVETLSIEPDEDTGNSSITCSGRLAESVWLFKRIIWGRIAKTGAVNKVMEELVNTQAVNPIDPKRKIAHVVIPTSMSIGESISYIKSYGNVWQQIEELSKAHNLDARFVYDPSEKLFNFVVKSGTDRSKSVRVTSDLGIFFDSKYSLDVSDYCNTALIAGEGEGENRVITSIGNENTGLSRNELYVDARDLQSDSSITYSSEDYTAALKSRGTQKLTEYPKYEEYATSLRLTGREAYKYGKDYFLGDLITIEDTQLGISAVMRVGAEEMSRDRNGETKTLVLGLELPTITRLLKRRDS